MAIIKCPECERSVSDQASKCPNCGYSIADLKHCEKCNSIITEREVVCHECGHPAPWARKCPDCGNYVHPSEEACPECGCDMVLHFGETAPIIPTKNVEKSRSNQFISRQYTEQSPKSNKRLIFAFLAVGAILLGVGGWLISVTFHKSTNNNREIVPLNSETVFQNSDNTHYDPNAIVELTPEFIEKVQKYDRLAPFSEGRAAVCRDGLWGYIDTKGDEVISCQYSYDNNDCITGAEMFHDGVAQVYKEGKGYYITRNGKVIFEGEGGRFSEGLALMDDGRIVDQKGNTKFSVDMNGSGYIMGSSTCNRFYTNYPYFINGVISIWVNNSDDYGSTEKYFDCNGQQVPEPTSSEIEEEYTSFSVYGNISEFSTGNSTGLKDKAGNIVIPAKYSEIGTPHPDEPSSDPIVSNGVALVAVRENDTYFIVKNQIEVDFSDGAAHEFTPRYYAYADLKGNTTFSQKVTNHIEDANRIGREKWVEQERIREAEEARGPEWLQGLWQWSGYKSGYYLQVSLFINRDTKKYAVEYDSGDYERGTYEYKPSNHTLYCKEYGKNYGATTYEVDEYNRRISLGDGLYLTHTHQ